MEEPKNGVWKAKFAQQTSLFAAALRYCIWKHLGWKRASINFNLKLLIHIPMLLEWMSWRSQNQLSSLHFLTIIMDLNGKCKLDTKISFASMCLLRSNYNKIILFHSFLFLDYWIVLRWLWKLFLLAACNVDRGRYPKTMMITMIILLLLWGW